jgi:hypothetical protein
VSQSDPAGGYSYPFGPLKLCKPIQALVQHDNIGGFLPTALFSPNAEVRGGERHIPLLFHLFRSLAECGARPFLGSQSCVKPLP